VIVIDTIDFQGKDYLTLQSTGFAAQFAFPFADKLLKGVGFDVGCGKREWAYPHAIPIDKVLPDEWDAMNLPPYQVDYVVSSHMLEHFPGRFQDAIEYWLTVIKKGGIILLYLPNCDYQKYWAWGNKKHIHYLSPSIMKDYLSHLEGITKYIVTEGYDLNGSFYVVIEK
jgi:SAM-dependent methyltransferase